MTEYTPQTSASAHETTLRPTQEQMLRWLGIKTGDSEHDMILIPQQYIKREDAHRIWPED